jgi:dienelactone hydrolase
VADLEFVCSTNDPFRVAATPSYDIHAIRWPVLDGVEGEGLLLRPKQPPIAHVIALPDADWTPEMVSGLSPGLEPEQQFARRLVERGCQVVAPMLINRDHALSGNPAMRMTDQPHREFIYRMAFEMGRHIIGYEVQKVMALVDFFSAQMAPDDVPVGVFGFGEGGLLALYSGALDERIAGVGVSGHFRNRTQLWQEPLYRNVWRLQRGFSDAELASMIAPRPLVVEATPAPSIPGPPPIRTQEDARGQTAAPGKIEPAPTDEIAAEVARAQPTYAALGAADRLVLVGGPAAETGPGSDDALDALLQGIGVQAREAEPGPPPRDARTGFDSAVRQERQFNQIVNHVQQRLEVAWRTRENFWSEANTSSPEAWEASAATYRKRFWEDLIGRCPDPSLPFNSRSRPYGESEAWDGYEVTLDVHPDIFTHGILLVPKGIAPGEQRPVVVCQHGLEGRPEDVIKEGEGPYHAFAARLAERGFITYAPQNPYIGFHEFRTLQRKANPLGWTLFTFAIAQHQQQLRWLSSLPFVDPDRIGFYGLSYGGKAAMRIPTALTQYALTICSGDFNEWARKCASIDYFSGYMFNHEWEMAEFDLGQTFNYAEMAYLMAPRPFMVERGHRDAVASDEWCAYEYARVQRRYADLNIPDRAEIYYFDGGHMIESTGTFAFLDKHLNWTPRRSGTAF